MAGSDGAGAGEAGAGGGAAAGVTVVGVSDGAVVAGGGAGTVVVVVVVVGAAWAACVGRTMVRGHGCGRRGQLGPLARGRRGPGAGCGQLRGGDDDDGNENEGDEHGGAPA